MKFVVRKDPYTDEVSVTLPNKTKRVIKQIYFGACLGVLSLAAYGEVKKRNQNEIEPEL